MKKARRKKAPGKTRATWKAHELDDGSGSYETLDLGSFGHLSVETPLEGEDGWKAWILGTHDESRDVGTYPSQLKARKACVSAAREQFSDMLRDIEAVRKALRA